MKLSIVEVFAQETSTQANSFTVFLSLKCMYELLKCKEEPKTKVFYVRILCCIYKPECNLSESLQPLRQMHCFKTIFAFSSRPKQFVGYYFKAHGPSAPRPKAHLLIYIYIYILGRPTKGSPWRRDPPITSGPPILITYS